jgi:hypothetical protein
VSRTHGTSDSGDVGEARARWTAPSRKHAQVAPGQEGQGARCAVMSLAAHLRYHLLHDRLDELRGAAFGAPEFGFDVVAEV